MALLTTAQVAEELQVHHRHVLTLIDSGQLAAINIGSNRTHGARWRVDRKDLDAYLRARRKAS